MAGTVGVFDFDMGATGPFFVSCRAPLSSQCASESEIDANIRLLKEDLDAVAARMKRALSDFLTLPVVGDPY